LLVLSQKFLQFCAIDIAAEMESGFAASAAALAEKEDFKGAFKRMEESVFQAVNLLKLSSAALSESLATIGRTRRTMLTHLLSPTLEPSELDPKGLFTSEFYKVGLFSNPSLSSDSDLSAPHCFCPPSSFFSSVRSSILFFSFFHTFSTCVPPSTDDLNEANDVMPLGSASSVCLSSSSSSPRCSFPRPPSSSSSSLPLPHLLQPRALPDTQRAPRPRLDPRLARVRPNTFPASLSNLR